MKKTLFMLVVAALFSAASEKAFAQYEKGDKLLNVGIGLGSYYGGGVALGASFEYGVTDFISVGAQADFYTWGYNWGSGYKYRYTFLPIAARGSYHFGKHFLEIDKLDLYGGAALGYYISSYSADTPYGGVYDDTYGSKVLFGVFGGGKYYFKPNMAAFAEVGYNVTPLKVGIAFKF